ncbi:hypothetical protein [Marinobacter sp. SS13-12]|uniref:hypothetical protein n=1 Tax=Marinobacter sp. SS13-12 TaxID=3050451 RepID=UPI0025561972|nr:hypothetical protein [Marinobacter sp. SS13-12]MDK8465907.1 hypothetical protein [Marinobacter sp. SS13-12]
MRTDKGEMKFDQQALALASEALRVKRTSNCTLFAIPEPDSEWGFVPESFLGSADWMFSAEGIMRSGISTPAFQLAQQIQGPKQLNGADLKSLARGFMVNQLERVAMFELVEALFPQIPELDDSVNAAVKSLDYDDFQTASID